MTVPYSLDLRERVVAAVGSGMSRRGAAKQYQVSYAAVIRWVARSAQTGSPAALPMGGKKPFKLSRESDWILRRLAEKPDITGRDLLAELHERGVDVSYYAVWNFLDRAGLSYKKNFTRQRTGPPKRRKAACAMATASRQC